MPVTHTSRLQLGLKTATVGSLAFGAILLLADVARADIFRVDYLYFQDRMNEEYYPPANVGKSRPVQGATQARRKPAGFGYLPSSSQKPSQRSRRR